jgi:ribonuclease P protein component
MLPSPERLRTNSEFQAVYKQGRSFSDDWVVLYFLKTPELLGRQVGFSVSKKVGNAVVRNRTKRRMREIYTHVLGDMPGGFQAIFIARKSASTAPYKDLDHAMRKLLIKAGLLPCEGVV